MNVRRAVGVIFAITALIPLLVFLFFLWRFDLAVKTEAQIGFLLALTLALLGLVLFRRLADRVADLAPRDPATDSLTGHTDIAVVPGLGRLNEIGDIAATLTHLTEDLRTSTARLEDLVFKLGTLSETVELASKIPKIEDLLSHVLERTMRAVQATVGSIMLLDSERRTLRIAAARGLPRDVLGLEVGLNDGVAGSVVQLGEPVLVEDIATDPRFARPNDPKYGCGSFISLPLRVGDRIIGVLNVAKRAALSGAGALPPFTPTDLQFLGTLMTCTAYAVDDARLLEEARQSAARLQEVVEDQKKRLTIAQQQMVQAAKLAALGQLVAGVAHELNNPLTVLMGGLELLGDEAPESLHRQLDVMSDSVDRARHIVQGLLTFARRVRLERRNVSPVEIVDKVLAMTAADLGLARIEVDTAIEPDLPLIWGDANQLQQVLLNMVTNAKQAMADVIGERHLRIAARRIGPNRLQLEVADTGPGIPAALLPTIFDPFVSTKGPEGTGLGLSICYGIIREHGGEIAVNSTEGVGTTFTIELPIGRAGTDTPPVISDAASEPVFDLTGARIAVVEDDQGLLDTLRGQLERAGCVSLGFRSAEEALERLADPVDLILFDFYLPGMSGFEFYREAVRQNRSLDGRFLLITGGRLPEAAQRLVADGAWRLLQKPFSRRQLLATIHDVLEQRGRTISPR